MTVTRCSRDILGSWVVGRCGWSAASWLRCSPEVRPSCATRSVPAVRTQPPPEQPGARATTTGPRRNRSQIRHGSTPPPATTSIDPLRRRPAARQSLTRCCGARRSGTAAAALGTFARRCRPHGPIRVFFPCRRQPFSCLQRCSIRSIGHPWDWRMPLRRAASRWHALRSSSASDRSSAGADLSGGPDLNRKSTRADPPPVVRGFAGRI